MDTNLLKRYDIAQDINALYKEILRNCKYNGWYCCTPHYRQIDRLVMEVQSNYFRARTNDVYWTVEKWINLT